MGATKNQIHSFYIPVLGTGFTIDTPLRVGRYGITSVISLVDDTIIEEARRYYCNLYNKTYEPVGREFPDRRAERIRRYLDLCDQILAIQMASMRVATFEPGSEAARYFELLPDSSPGGILYRSMVAESDSQRREELQVQLRSMIIPGSIDVNIMVKLDCDSWAGNEKLPPEQADAMAALRGFALSTVNSSVIFSAGLNRRLYTYLERFPGFYPDKHGVVKKHVIIKVSDYRSAIAQGKFLAKKGIWVDEFRIESGLNCGGHAFATAGYLLGPVMDEFRSRREELTGELFDLYCAGLTSKGFVVPEEKPGQRTAVQGGVTSSSEHRFMHSHYCADAVGWGTPFLLVPEATRVQPEIVAALARAGTEDVKLSQASPLNVLFSNLLTSKSESARLQHIRSGRPGVICKRGHLASNTEFTKKPVCTATSFYQQRKIEAIEADVSLTKEECRTAKRAVTEKACICFELGGSALIAFGAEGAENVNTAICPGPNIAHFNRTYSLEEMVGHIYGRVDLVNNPVREHFLLTEIKLYLEHLTSLISDFQRTAGEKAANNITEFIHNLKSGITSYVGIVRDRFEETIDRYEQFEIGVNKARCELENLSARFNTILSNSVGAPVEFPAVLQAE
jgi:hypothetical protein